MTESGLYPPHHKLHGIVNCGQDSKVIQQAKKHGVLGATVLIGYGTVKSRLLEWLALTDVRKEIVMMVGSEATIRKVLAELDDIFQFHKPHHGIAFTTPVCYIGGTHGSLCPLGDLKKGAENTMYQAISVVVDKGRAELVIDAATRAGSKGGTIINARGSGIHETQKLFAMAVEPEKEMVLILSHRDRTEAIVDAIREDLKIDEPGNGILFVESVSQAYGLYE
jgi:nitrogen regulatory protein PII